MPDLNRHGPPRTLATWLFSLFIFFCLSFAASSRLVLLKMKRDVSRIVDAELVANANDHSPSRRLESVVVDTGFACIKIYSG